jgi:hypothetical protein
MFKEEIPAVVSLALIAAVFLVAFWQDTRRTHKLLASRDRVVSKIDARSSSRETPRGEHKRIDQAL